MNQAPASFTSKTLLYWLCGAFALALVLIGLLAIVAPANAAILFGLSASTNEAIPWVRLAGVRDVALGLIFFTMTVLKQGRATGILMLLTAVVPVADVVTVFLRSGLGYPVFIHGSGILFLLVVGTLLVRSK